MTREVYITSQVAFDPSAQCFIYQALTLCPSSSLPVLYGLINVNGALPILFLSIYGSRENSLVCISVPPIATNTMPLNPVDAQQMGANKVPLVRQGS